MKAKKVELLAPAGNVEGFYGALAAGADAVYLGGAKFGARAYAENFTEEELIRCIRYAHVLGRKVYLTVNTLVKDREWEELDAAVRPFYEAGLDGVIVQDLGVLLYIREHFPDMELHASTQMTLTGAYGASYVKELGVSRIVPARELSLKEIKRLKEETGLEIEVFVHGAMCYCYSGQCLFSSLLGGRSGNRGRCAQPCRLPYSVSIVSQEEADRKRPAKDSPAKDFSAKDQPACYPLSLKDLCTIEFLPDLIEAGIDSFKIEGRMKKPEYAAGVTAIYRKYIDRYYDHPESRQRIEPEDLKTLSSLYIRSGIQEGYYHKHNGREMITLDSPAYRSSDEACLEQIRKNYLQKKKTLPVDIYGEFACGKPAQVTFLCGDCSVTVTGEMVQTAQNQPVTEENIRKQLQKLGDTVFSPGEIYITADENVFYPLKALNELRRRAVSDLEEKLIRQNGLCAGRKGEEVTRWEEKLIREKGLCAGRRGEEASWGEEKLQIGEDPSEMESGQTEDPCPVQDTDLKRGVCPDQNLCPGFSVSLATTEQCRGIQELILSGYLPARIYLDSDLVMGQNSAEAKKLAEKFAQNTEVFLALPRILRRQDESYLKEVLSLACKKEISGCMVRSLEGYAYLKAHHYQKKIAADACFYIWNRRTLQYWRDKLDAFCLPLELNAGEQRALLQEIKETETGMQEVEKSRKFPGMSAEKMIYGYLPMMVTANCAAKTMGRCFQQTGKECPKEEEPFEIFLTDRYQKRFPVQVNCRHCMNIIYNSVPLSLHHTCMKWKDLARLQLDFTVETGSKTKEIVRFFCQLQDRDAQDGDGKSFKAEITETDPVPFRDYTAGHEKRGVE